jgi:hypothetical protein
VLQPSSFHVAHFELPEVQAHLEQSQAMVAVQNLVVVVSHLAEAEAEALLSQSFPLLHLPLGFQ